MAEIQIETDTDNVGQVLLEKYHAGMGSGIFRVSIEDAPISPDPVPEVRGVTLTFDDGQ